MGAFGRELALSRLMLTRTTQIEVNRQKSIQTGKRTMLSKRFPNIERRSPRYLDVWDAAAGAGQTRQEYADKR